MSHHGMGINSFLSLDQTETQTQTDTHTQTHTYYGETILFKKAYI